MISTAQLVAALDKVAERIGIADRSFDGYTLADDEWHGGNAKWHLELAFVQLLAITEALQLPMLRADIAATFSEARREGMLTAEADPAGEPHQKWATSARRYWAALQESFAIEPAHTITKDLESILRAATYSITDSAVFGAPPENESTVHTRIESVLRCIFPDLIRKPRLGKPIKNFEPDTGIPSMQTLIEYKFISAASQVALVVDQLLADTRGYTSKEWNSFLYLIYETERFRSEAEWRQLLRECGVESNATVVVMSGSSVPRMSGPRAGQPNKRLQPSTPRANVKRRG